MRALIGLGLLILTLLTIGRAAPRLAISSGLEEYSGTEERVARSAWVLTSSFVDHPVPLLWTTAVRVTAVRREPGNCPVGEPNPGIPESDFVAVVQTYTFFGIPLRSYEVTCGGWRI